ncbi:hypothetical protein EDB80DRAFT_758075 [Ilyonectria destructans]|nr:hypothetical protein EDB80DRAFT_758075 [Ilyonectria destructans]
MQLGSFVRQVRIQTVWLTATLPPVFKEIFVHRNLLVRPHIVRESTNRANIQYGIRRFKSPGGLYKRAAELVRSFVALMGKNNKDGGALADGEKARIILGPTGSPVIVATSALGIGFDYPYVRWVVYAGAPRRMTDFSQESGRAGRDGERADRQPVDLDEESMQLYLTQKHCSRAVMSQFLDKRSDWRWYIEGEDELCNICPKHHTEPRPSSLELRLPAPDTTVSCDGKLLEGSGGSREEAMKRDMEYTSPDEVLRQTMVHNDILSRFEADLEIIRSYCLLCRVEGRRPFDHSATACSRHFTAYFIYYLPQTICRRADPEIEDGGEEEKKTECRFRDMIVPLYYGAFYRSGPRALIKKHFPQSFRNIEDYMQWLGESAILGGTLYVQAICVVAILLAEFE